MGRRNRDRIARAGGGLPDLGAGPAAEPAVASRVPARRRMVRGLLTASHMRRPGVHGGAVLALCGGLLWGLPSCLLYTDPVNRPPVLEIVPPTLIYPNQPAEFHAVRRDPDEDMLSLKLEWGYSSGDCPATPAAFTTTSGGRFAQTETLQVPGDVTAASFCVWARVTDRHGAQDSKLYFASPQNRPPTAMLTLLAPPVARPSYPLFTRFQIGATMSDPDGDELSHEFSFEPPVVGQATEMVPCSSGEADPKNICFVATRSGMHKVRVDVTDSHEATATAMLVLAIDDKGPPCIRDTDPPWNEGPSLRWNPEVVNQIEVKRVEDDDHPYPPESGNPSRTAPSFFWYLAKEGEPLSLYQVDLPILSIAPDSFPSLTTIQIRLDVDDGSQDLFDACAEKPFCESRPTCNQRVSWTVVFQ
jgi:hypothetical protein